MLLSFHRKYTIPSRMKITKTICQTVVGLSMLVVIVQNASMRSRAGLCPHPLLAQRNWSSRCLSDCAHDYHCKPYQKCCSYDYCASCIDIIPKCGSHVDRTSHPPGAGKCFSQCDLDNPCPLGEACCRDGCKSYCYGPFKNYLQPVIND
ncbi:WAP four-disulfide core domain protein 2-like isoform X2 [Pecten maximus]|uniref:WAP four-disulfide core domain protein 2-like isoform X2 n=1 Tax=Pecten maximus TaxID=6579 RepID=UPI001457F7BC|nr:WAP four-disulfide core domain protein 2-like isoform X2 [Pecten maximus]